MLPLRSLQDEYVAFLRTAKPHWAVEVFPESGVYTVTNPNGALLVRMLDGSNTEPSGRQIDRLVIRFEVLLTSRNLYSSDGILDLLAELWEVLALKVLDTDAGAFYSVATSFDYVSFSDGYWTYSLQYSVITPWVLRSR